MKPFLILHTPNSPSGRAHRYVLADLRSHSEESVASYCQAVREGQESPRHLHATRWVTQKLSTGNRTAVQEDLILAVDDILSEPSTHAIKSWLQECLERYDQLPLSDAGERGDLCESHPLLVEWEREIVKLIEVAPDVAPATPPEKSTSSTKVSRPKPRETGPTQRRRLAMFGLPLLGVAACAIAFFASKAMKPGVDKQNRPDGAEQSGPSTKEKLGDIAKQLNIRVADLPGFIAAMNSTPGSDSTFAPDDAVLSALNKGPCRAFLTELPHDREPTPTDYEKALEKAGHAASDTDPTAIHSLTQFLTAVSQHKKKSLSAVQMRVLMSDWTQSMISFQPKLPKPPDANKPLSGEAEGRISEKDSDLLTELKRIDGLRQPDFSFFTLADARRWYCIASDITNKGIFVSGKSSSETLQGDQWGENLQKIYAKRDFSGGSFYGQFLRKLNGPLEK